MGAELAELGRGLSGSGRVVLALGGPAAAAAGAGISASASERARVDIASPSSEEEDAFFCRVSECFHQYVHIPCSSRAPSVSLETKIPKPLWATATWLTLGD